MGHSGTGKSTIIEIIVKGSGDFDLEHK